jgi:DNA polymerase I
MQAVTNAIVAGDHFPGPIPDELRQFRRVWALDFEFETTSHPVKPVAMVAVDILSGTTLRLGPETLELCPFSCNSTELFVAFYAVAEASCFIALCWPVPHLWLDVWAEAKRMANGRTDADGRPLPAGMLDVLRRYGLPVRDHGHKKSMQTLVGGGTWQAHDLPAIIDYCHEDVVDTIRLLRALWPSITQEAPVADPEAAFWQALVRGTSTAYNAIIEAEGLPVDVTTWQRVTTAWPNIKEKLIEAVDADYGVFVDGSFNATMFASYLARENIPWPRLPSSALMLDDDTFRHRAKSEPKVQKLRELRSALSQMRGNSIAVDIDGRSRTPLRPLASKTGRSQPSTSRFLFGAAKWARSFIRAPEGHAFAYLDFKSQEIAIAAYLSGDEKLADSYRTGDPYLAFAKQAGLIPPDGTKRSHPQERAAAKAIVLGVAYGMGEEAMSANSGVPIDMCRDLLLKHRFLYRPYWSLVREYRERLALNEPGYTPLGWRIRLGPGSPLNERSNGNWPIQSTGSDILRLSVINCVNAGVKPCATIHDALAFVVPIDRADEMLATAKAEMERAAMAVTGGHIGVDVTRYDAPHVYQDETGFDFYQIVTAMAEC